MHGPVRVLYPLLMVSRSLDTFTVPYAYYVTFLLSSLFYWVFHTALQLSHGKKGIIGSHIYASARRGTGMTSCLAGSFGWIKCGVPKVVSPPALSLNGRCNQADANGAKANGDLAGWLFG